VQKAVSILSWFLGVCALAGAAGAQPFLRIVDDVDHAIDERISVCFQVELAQQCSEVQSGAAVTMPPAFTSVRAEGAHHGPVSVHARDLHPAPEGGPPVLRVPRKAFLRVEGLPADPLTVEVFRARAPSFRNPVFRGVVGAAEAEIPSGELVLALEARGRAPDLQRLTAAPATHVKVAYRQASGWSLIVRCREATRGGAVVPGASVRLAGKSEATGKDGLALLSGLGQALALEVVHPKYLVQEQEPPSALAGTFTFREVALGKGGTLRARVTLDGKPASGAYCTVLEAEARPGSPVKYSEGGAGADGICRSGQLAAGAYTLRVSLPETRTFTDHLVSVREGEETAADIALNSIRVTGRVSLGGKPAPGYMVMAVAEGQEARGGLPTIQAATDEYGDFEATVWAPGEYLFRLTADTGVQVAGERRVGLSRPQETVDFELDGTSIGGQVVDEKGQPLAGARVSLLWQGNELVAVSGEDGKFEILVAESGAGEISASRGGYDPSPARQVSPHSNVVLVLHKQSGEH
jgi:hypothetical protein